MANDDDADEELREPEYRQPRLERADEQLGLNRRDDCAGRQQHDGLPGRQLGSPLVRARVSVVGGPEQIAVSRERVNQAPDVRADQHHGASEAQPLDRGRPRGECAEQDEIEHRGHHERDDRQKKHRSAVVGAGAVEFLRTASQAADKEGQPEHEEQVADDAAGDGGLNKGEVPLVKRDDCDDQFSGVPEGGVQKPAPGRSGTARQFLGPKPDDPRKRDERNRRGDEDPG